MQISIILSTLVPITQEVQPGFLLGEIAKAIRKDGLKTLVSIMILLGRFIKTIV